MKLFDDRFHAVLHEPVRPSNVKLFEEQLAYSQPQAQTAALQMQDEILKRPREQQEDRAAANDLDDMSQEGFLAQAVLHNLRNAEGKRVDRARGQLEGPSACSEAADSQSTRQALDAREALQKSCFRSW